MHFPSLPKLSHPLATNFSTPLPALPSSPRNNGFLGLDSIPELPWQMNKSGIIANLEQFAVKRRRRGRTDQNVPGSTKKDKTGGDPFLLIFKSPLIDFPFPPHKISLCKSSFFIVEESINRDKKIWRSCTCAILTGFHATKSCDKPTFVALCAKNAENVQIYRRVHRESYFTHKTAGHMSMYQKKKCIL